MILSILAGTAQDRPAGTREAYLKRLEEIYVAPESGCETVAAELSEEAHAGRKTMYSDNGNGHAVGRLPLVEVTDQTPCGVTQHSESRTEAGKVKGQVLPWQRLAEQLAPKFSEAFLGAAEAIYRMTEQEWTSREEVLRGTADVSETLDRLSRDLQSMRELVASLAESQLSQSAKVDELETSVEDRVFHALERGLECLDKGMQDRQEATENRIASLSEEVFCTGQRLEAHAAAIRSLAETMRSQLERREEFKIGLERLAELVSRPVTLGPLPDGL